MASLKIDEAVFDKLAEILKKHDLNEIEYKVGDMKIRLAAGKASTVCSEAVVPVSAPAAKVQLPKVEETKAEQSWDSHPGALKSPVIGTCYLAPEPGAPNFVSVGDTVQEGQPVLIIEAMKVMNMIKAHKSGKVVHMAVKNSEPIEFGQLLLVIE